LILPSGIYSSEDFRCVLICSLAQQLGIDPLLYEGSFEAKEMSPVEEAIFKGMIVQIQPEMIGNPIRLTTGKKGIELGRAIIHAQIIKRKFAQISAEQYLRKNAFFFGNEDAETQRKVGYSLKVISSAFSSVNGGSYYAEIVKDLIHKVGDSVFVPKDTLAKYIVGFKDLLGKFERPVYSIKKGKQVLTGYKRPKKPSRSPVFTKDENDEINALITLLWDSMTSLEKEWSECPIDDLSLVYQRVEGLINHRWSLLARYAKMTTKRLEAIRVKNEYGTDKKKRDISVDDLKTFQETIKPLDFIKSLRQLAKDDQEFLSMIEFRFQQHFSSVKEASATYTEYVMYSIYKTVEAYKPPEEKSPFAKVESMENLIRHLLIVQAKTKEFEKQRDALLKNAEKIYKAYGSAVHLVNISKKVANSAMVLASVSHEQIQEAENFGKFVFGINVSSVTDLHGKVLIKESIKRVHIGGFDMFMKPGDNGQTTITIPEFLREN
jgi:hypothetical protein